MPLAWSYLRFSKPEQEVGDSARRQEQTADWCRRHRVKLDESLTIRDPGVSAFRGKHRENPDTHALAGFLKAVESGRVPVGSFLVVEALDRLTREKIRPALTLLLNLIEAGVKVVQLQPIEKVYDEDVDPATLMMAIMELNRGHSESAMKSDRCGAAWANKRARLGEKKLSRKLPGWVVAVGGENKRMKDTAPGEVRLVLDPGKAATVRRAFDLARGGMGVHRIAKLFNAEKVPLLGRSVITRRGQRHKPPGERERIAVRWNETTVYEVLKSRAAIGEYQPHQGRGSDRRPVGNPIPDYYPAAVDADAFHAVQALITSKARVGRRGKNVNLFTGLLRDARDGGTLTYRHVEGRPVAVIPVAAKQGKGTPWTSFPARPLEDAVVSRLVEVRSADVFGTDDAGRRVESLSGRVAEAEARVKFYRDRCDESEDAAAVFADKAVEWEGRRKALAAELADARRQAANPMTEIWGEFRSLAELMAADPSDELREKVRSALRRAVETIHCLFTGRGPTRLAAVRVQFRNTDSHRDYVVAYYPGRSNGTVKRQGRWEPLSFVGAGGLDLRKPDHAAKVERLLARLDLSGYTGSPTPT
jgi:DNA invertase Pin-like site-specific DNA recombinase